MGCSKALWVAFWRLFAAKKTAWQLDFAFFFIHLIWKIEVWTSASVDFTVGTAGLGRGSPTLRALLAPFRFTAPIASRFAAAALRFGGAPERALAATDEGTGAAGPGAGLDRTGMGAKAGELGSGDTSRVKGFSLSALAIRVTRGRPSPAMGRHRDSTAAAPEMLFMEAQHLASFWEVQKTAGTKLKSKTYFNSLTCEASPSRDSGSNFDTSICCDTPAALFLHRNRNKGADHLECIY